MKPEDRRLKCKRSGESNFAYSKSSSSCSGPLRRSAEKAGLRSLAGSDSAVRRRRARSCSARSRALKNVLTTPPVSAAAAQGHERSRRPSIPGRARSIDFAEPRRQPPGVPRRDSRLETTPRHRFGPHSDTTLPNEPGLRTMWAAPTQAVKTSFARVNGGRGTPGPRASP